MKVYFLSSTACALTINGAYFGITDGFERFAEIELSDNVYALFSPQNALPLGCFLSENIRFSPPEGFEIYLLPDGLALYARDFPPRDFTLKTIAQKRENNTLVTLFQQGETQLSIEVDGSLAVVKIPRAFECAEIRFMQELIALRTEDKLALYTKKGECIFCENVIDYRLENGELHASLSLLDSLGRTAECSYLLSENCCERTAFSLKQTRTENGDANAEKIAEELLPFAFFESVLIGADYAQFLSDELAPKADSIRAFLGDFVAVIPTRTPSVCGLVKRKGERLYELTHYAITLKDGKIVDIRG